MVICILKQFDGSYNDVCIKLADNIVQWLKDTEWSWSIRTRSYKVIMEWEE